MMSGEPTTEGAAVGPVNRQVGSDWRQGFKLDHGVNPNELEDVDIGPFDPSHAVLGMFNTSEAMPNVSIYSAAAQQTTVVTNETSRILYVIDEAPVGAIISMNRGTLNKPPDVMIFRKLKSGKLAQLRSPRPLKYTDPMESGRLGDTPPRDIADTVLD